VLCSENSCVCCWASGQLYRTDPTILAWELCNECATDFNWEQARGLTNGGLLYSWVRTDKHTHGQIGDAWARITEMRILRMAAK
jgi:hypothetical protein